MINDIFNVFGEQTAEILFEIITECMDDYLYIFDLQNNTFEIPMVHSINVRICAEGIEEKEWLLKMKEMKVDYLQGYYFRRPCGKKQFLQQYANGINVK